MPASQITLLIDKARSNTELLSDMLVNSGGQGADEFENDLIKDLMKEVRTDKQQPCQHGGASRM